MAYHTRKNLKLLEDVALNPLDKGFVFLFLTTVCLSHLRIKCTVNWYPTDFLVIRKMAREAIKWNAFNLARLIHAIEDRHSSMPVSIMSKKRMDGLLSKSQNWPDMTQRTICKIMGYLHFDTGLPLLYIFWICICQQNERNYLVTDSLSV